MKRIFALAAALLLAAGCSWFPWEEARINIENSKQLRVGMTKAEVLDIMGEPIGDEVFCRPDVWFYYSTTEWADGLVTEDECLPLVFEKGVLVGWGRAYYAEHRTTPPPAITEVPRD